MNKRIEDLKGKALDQAVPYTWHHLNHVQIDDVMNKLAELIVRECLGACSKQAADWEGDYADAYNDGVRSCIDVMKEDFGVEE